MELGESGISKHTACVISDVDEYDNMIFRVAGTSNVSSDIIKDTIAKYISKGSKIITNCKSSYEKVAKENNWRLKQAKSKGHVDAEGNTLVTIVTINPLHSELEHFLSGFRGVSTKHLSEYLDWFVYMKYLNYSKEYIEQRSTYKIAKFILNNIKIVYSCIDLINTHLLSFCQKFLKYHCFFSLLCSINIII